MLQSLGIIALSIGAAVGYGIVHDQITAHLCVEYFTLGHPPVFATQSPFLLGLGWGVIATWWVGLLLGLPLAAMARVGAMPQVMARELKIPLLILMAVSGLLALVAGATGYCLASAGVLTLRESFAHLIRPERHGLFLADLWAHDASYLSGFFGGVILILWVYRERRRRFILAEKRLQVW